MSPEAWRKAEELFHQALDLPEDERASWVDRACAGDAEVRREVFSLLESDAVAAGKFVGAHVERAIVDLHEGERRSMTAKRVGPYSLVRELGRGGMGTVYLASRADDQYQAEVAIKLVRPGMDTEIILRRFRRERQILARLEHPNIARLLDGGTTEDGVPYLVMEYIDGIWITRYVEEQNLNIDERLRLFLPVCAAVEHAHRHFVVHRDLKPGNILINKEGTPKLLDFGISKLLLTEQSDATMTGEAGMMTPDYASPEQILGDPVTVATDVYALGVVLYELLTGRRPHRIDKLTPLALEHAICLAEVTPPSLAAAEADRGLGRRLAGDLDNIVMRALQKEPARRYASVEQLALDIRRHMDHLPIAARADTVFYRVRKFARRNRIVVGSAAMVMASLAGGVFFSLREARIAQQRFEQVRRLASTFVFDVDAAARDLPGSLRLRQLITRTGMEYLDNLAISSGSDHTLRRELAGAYQRIGDIQGGVDSANLGDPAAALASYRKAEKLLASELQSARPDRQVQLDWLDLLFRMGRVESTTAGSRGALALYQQGLKGVEGALERFPGDLEVARRAANFYQDTSRVKRLINDLTSAQDNAAKSLELFKKIVAAKPEDGGIRMRLATAYSELGTVQARMGQLQPALDNFRLSVMELDALCAKDPSNSNYRHELMYAHSHVGDTLGNPSFPNLGEMEGARAAYAKTVEISKMYYETDPADQRGAIDYGIALMRLAQVSGPERSAEALRLLLQAREILAGVSKANPRNIINATNLAYIEQQIGDLKASAGDGASAVKYLEQSMERAGKILAADQKQTSAQRTMQLAARRLGQVEASLGHRAKALAAVDIVFHVAENVKKTATENVASVRVFTPRAWSSAGAAYAALAALRSAAAETRKQDRQTALDWYRKAVAEWSEIEKGRGFNAQHRAEMQADEAALAALEKGER